MSSSAPGQAPCCSTCSAARGPSRRPSASSAPASSPRCRRRRPGFRTGRTSAATAAASPPSTRAATRRRWWCKHCPGRPAGAATGGAALHCPSSATASPPSRPGSAATSRSPRESASTRPPSIPVPASGTPLLGEDELEEGKLAKAQADGVGVLLVRTGGRVHALANRCSHRGCSLHKGKLSGDRVTCPCHGSTLRPDDGGVVKRPATSPQLAFEVRTHNGMIEIRRSQGRA